MLTINDTLPSFSVIAAKPGYNNPSDDAFETITNDSFPGKWKIIFFYPKAFTFVCPTELVAFAKLNEDFLDRDAVVMGGSADNEFVQIAWRREHPDLDKLEQYSFADANGELARALGVLDKDAKVPLRATFIVDPHNVIQHVSVNNLNVGRNPEEILRILDGLQTDELCACNRPLDGDTL